MFQRHPGRRASWPSALDTENPPHSQTSHPRLWHRLTKAARLARRHSAIAASRGVRGKAIPASNRRAYGDTSPRTADRKSKLRPAPRPCAVAESTKPALKSFSALSRPTHASLACIQSRGPSPAASHMKGSPQRRRLATSDGVRTSRSSGKSRGTDCRMRTDILSPRSRVRAIITQQIHVRVLRGTAAGVRSRKAQSSAGETAAQPPR